jgi:Contractile injection system tube protein
MSELKKATLQEIKSDEKGTPIGPEVEVQFNPTTLKLQINNTTEGGQSQGRQARQFIGASSTTLTLDLIFDTADEGTTDSPRNVREKTAQVEKFVLPQGTGKDKQAPPKVRFHWGTLILDGIIDSISLDFDLFAANGTPLRAKVGIAIKEQNSKYQFLKSGAGANQAGNVPAPGAVGAGSLGASASLGVSASFGISASFGVSASFGISAGFSASASVGLAIGGESSAEFAARAGLDPSAWRGLSVGGGSSLSLDAGAEIGFSAGLTASAGIGVQVGVEAGVSASLEGSFGLEATAGVSAVAGVGVGAGLAAGFNLSAAGGVSAAIESVKIAKTQAAEQKARQAFKAPAPTARQLSAATTTTTTTATTTVARASTATGGAGAASTQKPAMPEQQRAPLVASGLPSSTTQQAAQPAPAPPRADPRSTSFGFGVPLRSTVGQAANMRAGALQGHVALRPQVSSGEPPSTTDPTTPPWVSLPVRNRTSEPADQMNKGAHPCGCAACRGRGGRKRR